MSHHLHGIHCLHVHGWDSADGAVCVITTGRAMAHPSPTKPTNCAVRKEYQELINQLLVRGVILSIEAGKLPLDVEILNLDMSELGIHGPDLTPSAN